MGTGKYRTEEKVTNDLGDDIASDIHASAEYRPPDYEKVEPLRRFQNLRKGLLF